MEETRLQRENLGLKLTEARADSKKIIFWTAVRCALVFVILLAGVRGNPLSAPVSFFGNLYAEPDWKFQFYLHHGWAKTVSPGIWKYFMGAQERKGMNTTYIIIGVVAFVILFVIAYIKVSIDTKKGENSGEKRQIREIVDKVVPNGQEYTSVYATFDVSQFGGGGRSITVTTTYRYYALGFKQGTIYVIPLSFESGDVSCGEPMCLTRKNLGMVNADKDGFWASFYDKEQREIVSVMVRKSNTKDDKYHPVNIQQNEETEAFQKFILSFMEEVNRENHVAVTGKYGKPLKK